MTEQPQEAKPVQVQQSLPIEQKSLDDNPEFCINADLPEKHMRRWIQSGRICHVDGSICHGWDEKEVHDKCPVKKYGRKFFNNGMR